MKILVTHSHIANGRAVNAGTTIDIPDEQAAEYIEHGLGKSVETTTEETAKKK